MVRNYETLFKFNYSYDYCSSINLYIVNLGFNSKAYTN